MGIDMKVGAALALALLPAAQALAAEGGRRIEEIVITSERVESTVSDTAISVTAFSEEMLEDFGVQSADELIDYIPATTRDPFDIRIRGVGRNFRALGGDPGVATYYNGVYSPDFGIASSENALYDLARVEVLRGPQGTLYGRNSIGGALNYVTRAPTFEWSGEVRGQLGRFDGREYFGFISGPVIDDVLAFRLVGNSLRRAGSQENTHEFDDANSIKDENIALSLLWNITDDITLNTRVNDRLSNRVIVQPQITNWGVGPRRGEVDTTLYIAGIRRATSTTPGAIPFTDPRDGSTVFGAYLRPGIDPSKFPFSPLASFRNPHAPRVVAGDKEDIGDRIDINAGNGGGADCEFPYTDSTCQDEKFEHSANQTDISWNISEDVQLKYVFGYTDFTYHFNTDMDGFNSTFTQYRQTVEESVENQSHELQLNWKIGDKFSATSGVYYFVEDRDQDYSLTNSIDYYVNPVNYGAFATNVLPFVNRTALSFYSPGLGIPGQNSHRRLGSATFNVSGPSGFWEGDPRGDIYHHMNKVHNRSTAIFTQGTYQFNDEWALVLGIRYANDRKRAKEVRGGYFEIGLDPGLAGLLALTMGMPGPSPTNAITPLAIMNVAMGAASYTGDPNNPLRPTCALGSDSCATPLRLGAGIPISYTSSVKDGNEWEDTNYRVNVNWTPNDDTLVYASFTTGYRAGGYSLGVADARDTPRDALTGQPIPGAPLLPSQYDQEEVEAWELGYKGTFLDGTLQLNAAAYLYTYEGYQDEVELFDATRGPITIVGNAPKAENFGLEFDVLWLATEELTLGGNYSYTKAEYTDTYLLSLDNDPNLPPPLFDNPATPAGPIADRQDLFVVDQDGGPLKRIPAHKATVYANYVLTMPYGSFTFGGTYAYTGEQYDRGIETELFRVPSRFQVNLAVTFDDSEGKYSIRAFVDNVTDELNARDISNGNDDSNNNWRQTAGHLYPRFWGIDARYRFGN
jgi:outer membrane receptor protein involved in Fe transport